MPNYTKENAISLRVDAHILKIFVDNPNGFIDKFKSAVFERVRSGQQDFYSAFQSILDELRSHLRPQAANLPAVDSDDVKIDLGIARQTLRGIRYAMESEYNSAHKHSANFYSQAARINVIETLRTNVAHLAPIDQIAREAASLRAQNFAELAILTNPEVARAARSMYTTINNDRIEALTLEKIAQGVASKGSWQEFMEANGGGLIYASPEQKYAGQLNRAYADAARINNENNYGFSPEDLGRLAHTAIKIAQSDDNKQRQ